MPVWYVPIPNTPPAESTNVIEKIDQDLTIDPEDTSGYVWVALRNDAVLDLFLHSGYGDGYAAVITEGGIQATTGYTVNYETGRVTFTVQKTSADELHIVAYRPAFLGPAAAVASEDTGGDGTTIVLPSTSGGVVHYDYIVDGTYSGSDGVQVLMATGSSVKLYKTVQAAEEAAEADGGERSILINGGSYFEDVVFSAALTGDLWLYGEGVNKVTIRSLTISTTQVLHFKNITVMEPAEGTMGLALVHDAGGASTWDISYLDTPWTNVALPATITSERPRPWALTDQLWFVTSVGGFPDPTSQSAGNECNREMVRSTDGGATWAATVVGDETCTTERSATGDEINHFSRVARDAGGRIWAARKRGTTTAHPIRTEIWSSDSDGATLTWTLRATLTFAAAARYPYALLCHPTNPNIIALISASNFAPAGGDDGVIVYMTEDRGSTWTEYQATVASGNNFVLTANGQAFRAMMLPSGRIVIANRELTSSNCKIYTSDNKGATWQLRYTDAAADEDNMVLFTQGQWLGAGQHLVGIRVPVTDGVDAAWAIMESTDSGTTWTARDLPTPPATAVTWDAVYDPASDQVLVSGSTAGTKYVKALASATAGGESWEDIIGDLPTNTPSSLRWEGMALITQATASVLGTVADVQTHWEDCEIEGELDATLLDSSFRRCIVAKYSPADASAGVTFADCELTGDQDWDAASLGNHDFVNCRIDGVLTSSGSLNIFHFTNCTLADIVKNGGGGDVTFTACVFPAPAGSTGSVYIQSCSGTADPTIFRFVGGSFALGSSTADPFIFSDDADFQASIVGFDLIDNVNPYIIGKFKNSVFGPSSPPDFKVQLDAGSTNNLHVGLGTISGAAALTGLAPLPQRGSGAPTHTAPEGTPYWDTLNNKLYVNNDGATGWTAISGGGGGDVATDVIWDADGDLAVGSGADTAIRLARGSAGSVLQPSGTTLAWTTAPTIAGLLTASGHIRLAASGEIQDVAGTARIIVATGSPQVSLIGNVDINGTVALYKAAQDMEVAIVSDASRPSLFSFKSGADFKWEIFTQDSVSSGSFMWRYNGVAQLRLGKTGQLEITGDLWMHGNILSANGTQRINFNDAAAPEIQLNATLTDLTGDLRVTGNDIRDGTNNVRVTLGAPTTVFSDLEISATNAIIRAVTGSGTFASFRMKSGATEWIFGYQDNFSSGDLLFNGAGAGYNVKFGTDGRITFAGALDHDGSLVGFFAVAPVARASAYTQTYATADKTHANPTSADIGAFTGGSVGFLDAAERDNVRTQYNALRADVLDVKQLVNSVIDDLQAYGLMQ